MTKTYQLKHHFRLELGFNKPNMLPLLLQVLTLWKMQDISIYDTHIKCCAVKGLQCNCINRVQKCEHKPKFRTNCGTMRQLNEHPLSYRVTAFSISPFPMFFYPNKGFNPLGWNAHDNLFSLAPAYQNMNVSSASSPYEKFERGSKFAGADTTHATTPKPNHATIPSF
jgi:hypothetical protein